ncbi:MAG: hypothetical protein ABI724_00340 [Betaproteobacteria bacterium]
MMNLKFLAIGAVVMIVLMSGCATTPTKFRERNGDFIRNIALAVPKAAEIRG